MVNEEINYDDDVQVDNIHSEDDLDNFLYDLGKKLYPEYSEDEILDTIEEMYEVLFDKRLILPYNIDSITGDILSFYYSESEINELKREDFDYGKDN